MPVIGRAVFFIACVLLSVCLFGQSNSSLNEPVKLTFYYNQNWELTTPEKSFYRREAYFDLQEMVFDGVCNDYSKDNKLMAEGFYAHGAKRGIQTEYAHDRSVKSTIEFSGDDFIVWQWVNENKVYEITRGTGKFTLTYFYFFDLNQFKHGVLNGEFQNGRRVGKWLYQDSNKKSWDEEEYKNGKFVKRTHFTERGAVELDFQKEIIISVNSLNTETLAFDKEAFATLNQFFEQYISYPVSLQRKIGYAGGVKRLLRLLVEAGVPEQNLVLAKIKMDEHGQILKTTIVRPADLNSDERVLKAIEQHGGKILPAIKNGKPVAATIYLPVASGKEWQQLLVDMPADWFLNENNFW